LSKLTPLKTQWTETKVSGITEIPGLPGTRAEELPVSKDTRDGLHELFRVDEIPAGFDPLKFNPNSPHQPPQS